MRLPNLCIIEFIRMLDIGGRAGVPEMTIPFLHTSHFNLVPGIEDERSFDGFYKFPRSNEGWRKRVYDLCDFGKHTREDEHNSRG